MNYWKKFLEKFTSKSDMINLFAGMALIISLIFVYRNPYNNFAILTGCIAGGLMNIINGFNAMKDPKRKTTGITFLMMGVVLIILGFILNQIVKK